MAMAEFAPSYATLCLLFSCFLSGEISTLVNARATQAYLTYTPHKWSIFESTWCIAKASASQESLQLSLDYACKMTDCGPAREGGACFLPDTIVYHASFAMNSYYQTRGANTWNCYFSSTSLIAITNPSYGNCQSGSGSCQFGGSGKQELVKREKTWCVPKPGTPDSVLEANINFICGQCSDCSDIKKHGSCYLPNNLMNHVSVVMNLYYKTLGNYNCNFNNASITVITNPSFGSCIYA